MPMNELAKEKLRQLNKERRDKVLLAKDYAADQYLAHCDEVEDAGHLDRVPQATVASWVKARNYGCLAYLRWVPAGVSEALAARLPSARVFLHIGAMRTREVVVFDRATLEALLQRMRLNVRKYTNQPSCVVDTKFHKQ